MKKMLIRLFSVCLVVASAFTVMSCDNNQTNQAESTKIEQVYVQYVAHAEEEGKEPLSYEEWLASIKGEKGETGEQGPQGEKGEDGKGISSIDLVKTVGDIDYYEILFTDGSKFEFTIRNTRQLFFTITWKDEDGSILTTYEDVLYGSNIDDYYVRVEPSKTSDNDRYTYVFSGWEYDEALLESNGYKVTQDLIFIAKYEKVSNYETIMVYNQYNQLIDSVEVKKGTDPELDFDAIPDYIDNGIYYRFNEWYYDYYSKSIHPYFSSYTLKDGLYKYNGNIYEIEVNNGIISSKQITSNSQIYINDYFKDKYNNIYVKNDTFNYVDTESKIIYYVGDKYFKSESGVVIHFDFVGTYIGLHYEWRQNLKSIKKISTNCIEEEILPEDVIEFNTYSDGDSFIGSIKDGYLYVSDFQGWAYCYFTKLNVSTLGSVRLSFGSYQNSWGAMSIYTTNYSDKGMILCVQDENNNGTLYFIDDVWKYDGNCAFYSNIRTDDSLVTLLAENVDVTEWSEGAVEYRVIDGNSVLYYYIDFDESGKPVVSQR